MTGRLHIANKIPPRELTRGELAETRQLVTKWYANYDNGYKICLPLDCPCFMFGKAYAGCALCKYFKNAILPENLELLAVFNGEDVKEYIKPCSVCGTVLYSTSNNVKYCADCAKDVQRRQKRDYMRRKAGFGVEKLG